MDLLPFPPGCAFRSGSSLTGRPDIPSHPRHLTYISAVVFDSSCRHDVKTTAVILSLSATGSAASSTHYSRQAGVPSFWSYSVWNNLPPDVISAPTLAIFRQRLKTFPFTKSYHVSPRYSYLTSLSPVDLTIINII